MRKLKNQKVSYHSHWKKRRIFLQNSEKIKAIRSYVDFPEHMLENSRAKRKKKNLDMIAANNLKQQGAGFAGDTNVLTLITEDWEKELALMSKDEAAKCLLDELLKIKKNKK